MRPSIILQSLLCFSFISISVSAGEIPDWLIGKWRSNEEMTLRDMNKHPEVTEKAKKLFENHFFGRLVQVYRKRDATSYFIDEKPEEPAFEKHQTVIPGENSVTFRYFDKLFDQNMEKTFYLEGSCFYTYMSKWKFKEYFCRFDES